MTTAKLNAVQAAVAAALAAGEVQPVMDQATLIAAVGAGTPGIGGVIWDYWADSLLVQGVGVSRSSKRIWFTMAAGAYSGGVRAEMLEAPQKAKDGKPATPGHVVYHELVRRIMLTFSEDDQRLYAMEVSNAVVKAGMSPRDLERRAEIVKERDRHVSELRKYLEKFNDPEKRGATKQRTPDEMVRDMIGETLDYMRKSDYDFKFDLDDVFDPLKEIYEIVKDACGIVRKP